MFFFLFRRGFMFGILKISNRKKMLFELSECLPTSKRDFFLFSVIFFFFSLLFLHSYRLYVWRCERRRGGSWLVDSKKKNVNVRKSQSDGISRPCTDFFDWQQTTPSGVCGCVCVCVYWDCGNAVHFCVLDDTQVTKRREKKVSPSWYVKERMPDTSRSVQTLLSFFFFIQHVILFFSRSLLTREHDKVLIEIHWQ